MADNTSSQTKNRPQLSDWPSAPAPNRDLYDLHQQATSEVFLLLDERGAYRHVSEAYVRVFGTTPPPATAYEADAIHPEDRPDFLDAWQAYLADKEANMLHLTYRRRTVGAYRWVQAHITAATADYPGCYAVVLRDATRERQALERLERINASKDRLLAVVAHDLRNPLHSVQGILEIFRLELNQSDYQYETYFEMLGQATNKALHLIDELLEISDLESEHYTLERRSVPLADLLADVVGNYRTEASEQAVALHLDLPDTADVVALDPKRFTRVLDNLLSNALKFTPRHGRITLRARVGQSVRISLSDTGIGIPKKLLPLIFNKFSKARRQGLQGEKTTGLGMSIAKQIVELHSGRIWVESAENDGTTFFIELPVA